MTFPSYGSFIYNATAPSVSNNANSVSAAAAISLAQSSSSTNNCTCAYTLTAPCVFSVLGTFSGVPTGLSSYIMVTVNITSGNPTAIAAYANNAALLTAYNALILGGVSYPLVFFFNQITQAWTPFQPQQNSAPPSSHLFSPVYTASGGSTDGSFSGNAQLFFSLTQGAGPILTEESNNLMDSPYSATQALGFMKTVNLEFVEGTNILTVWDKYLGWCVGSALWTPSNTTVATSPLYTNGPNVSVYTNTGTSSFMLYKLTGNPVVDNPNLAPFNILVTSFQTPEWPEISWITVGAKGVVLRVPYAEFNPDLFAPGVVVFDSNNNLLGIVTKAFSNTNFGF